MGVRLDERFTGLYHFRTTSPTTYALFFTLFSRKPIVYQLAVIRAGFMSDLWDNMPYFLPNVMLYSGKQFLIWKFVNYEDANRCYLFDICFCS